MLSALLVSNGLAFGQDERLRLRVTWDSGEEVAHSGALSIDAGQVERIDLLDSEPDAARATWMEPARVVVDEPSPRRRSGFDCTLSAPLSARLRVRLGPRGASGVAGSIEATLAELVERASESQWNRGKARLRVERAPGDSLRVEHAGSSMVFSPEETMRISVAPYLLGVPGKTRIRLSAQLRNSQQGRPIEAREAELEIDDAGIAAGKAEFEFAMPRREGVYELELSATHRRLTRRLQVAQRRLQLLVVDSTAPEPAPSQEFETELEIDPGQPNLLKRFVSLNVLPGARRASLGERHAQAVSDSLGAQNELCASEDVSRLAWEAYTLPVREPGKPHLLEIELPSNYEQTLGVSILEPDAVGELSPDRSETSFFVSDISEEESPHWFTERVLFWPRTKSPIVLLTNRRTDRAARFGRLRLRSGPARLPNRAAPIGEGREFWAYLARPSFCELGGAQTVLDSEARRPWHDWNAFDQGATRLVERVKYAGHNGLMLGVATEGATIFPSVACFADGAPGTNARFDDGAIATIAPDPQPKDVLELLLRLCDRESLRMAPALNFNAPVPELEALRRESGSAAIGLEWIGADGRPWSPAGGERVGPYYNVLNPRVGQVLVDAAAGLARRYAAHPSFAGVAIPLDAAGFAQLPGLGWGFDDATTARFERDMGLSIPDAEGSGERFAQRARWLLGEQRDTWEKWRCSQLAELARRIEAAVRAEAPEARVFFPTGESFASQHWAREVLPTLPRRTSTDALFRRAGIALEEVKDAGLIYFRPLIAGEPRPLADMAARVQLNAPSAIDRLISAEPAAAVLCYRERGAGAVDSLERPRSWADGPLTLRPSGIAAGRAARREWVQALAMLDARLVANGASAWPHGCETACAEFAQAFCRLPAVPFETLSGLSQPVVVRTAVHGGKRFVYWLNNSPWPCKLTLLASAEKGATAVSLNPQQDALELSGANNTWELELAAFDFGGAIVSDAGATLRVADVLLDPAVNAGLDRRIKEVSLRAGAIAEMTTSAALENPGFESQAEAESTGADWSVSGGSKENLRFEERSPHSGQWSAALESAGPAVSLVSQPLSAPTTGRFSILVWLRVDDPAHPPAARLAVEATLDGRPGYYRYAALGARSKQPLGEQWEQYRFHVDDLPLAGLENVRVRIDLLGAGRLWIDDVETSELFFSEAEQRALQLLIFSAYDQLQKGQVADCWQTLEGYWPRFLLEHVEAPQEQIARQPRPAVGDPIDAPKAAVPRAESPPGEPRTGGLWDSMRRLLPKWY